jgi:hypothetical protein
MIPKLSAVPMLCRRTAEMMISTFHPPINPSTIHPSIKLGILFAFHLSAGISEEASINDLQ